MKQEFLKLTLLTDEIGKLVEKDSEFNDEFEAFSETESSFKAKLTLLKSFYL